MSEIILFRADSSSQIGHGHIRRDLVLAKQYENAKIIFACQELEGNLIDEIPYEVKRLKSNKADELIALIQSLHVSLLVIDHYEIDHHFEKTLKIQNPTLKILSFDDTYEKHDCDILLNHNLSADASRYEGKVPPHCELRCGKKYSLIREEFIQEKSVVRNKRGIIVIMGGSDATNITFSLLQALPRALHVKVVTTTANNHLEMLRDYINRQPNMSLHVNITTMARLMNESRLAIVTPSVVAQEALYMGLDIIAIKTVANQDDMYHYLNRQGYLCMQELQTQKLHDYLKSYIDFDILRSESIHYKDYKAVPLAQLTHDQALELLHLRNDVRVRQWMYTQHLISEAEHLSFIERLNQRDDTLHYAVFHNDILIAAINFHDINLRHQRANFGMYADPECKIPGLGFVLDELSLFIASEYLQLTTLRLEIFKENRSLIAIHQRMKFEIEGELRHYIQSDDGRWHDVVIMSHIWGEQ